MTNDVKYKCNALNTFLESILFLQISKTKLIQYSLHKTEKINCMEGNYFEEELSQ